jgi:site-specific recombinase XerD
MNVMFVFVLRSSPSRVSAGLETSGPPTCDGFSRRRPPTGQRRQARRARPRLKCFFRFLLENEAIERNPAQVLRTPKKREAQPDVLDRSELGRLPAIPDRPELWARVHRGKRERDRLLLALFAYAGLRRSELLSMDWDDVDLDRRLLRVRHAKGGRQRVVPLHPALVQLLVEYLALRMPLDEPALFTGVQGKRLTPSVLARTFLGYAHAASVSKRKRITPHTLRHVFASELLRAGANLRQVQELLGHKHLDSTQRYTHIHSARAARGSQATAVEWHPAPRLILSVRDVTATPQHECEQRPSRCHQSGEKESLTETRAARLLSDRLHAEHRAIGHEMQARVRCYPCADELGRL